jgi:hypothetical protein
MIGIRLKQPSAFSLLLLCAAVAGCSPAEPKADVASELAEQEELIEAMNEHPAFQEGASEEALGPPVYVPTTIPPPAAGAGQHDGHDDHSAAEAQANSL